MIEETDEKLKRQVREFWNAHPCGTQVTELEWGSKKFFDGESSRKGIFKIGDTRDVFKMTCQ